ncbi:MAG: thioesterase family protein [Atribacterota bacterium]
MKLRKQKRSPAKFPVIIRYEQNNKQENIKGKTVDINEGGIRLAMEKNIPNISSFNITIEFPKQKEPFDAQVKLVWSDALRKNYGVRFLQLTEDQKTKLSKILDIPKKKAFSFEKTIYLGDTNAEGNVYFAKYFEWQGQAREEFFRKNFPLEIWQSGLKLITLNSSCDFKQEAFLFDEIFIDVKIDDIKEKELKMAFIYINKNTRKIIAIGRQNIAFSDLSGNIIPVPDEIKSNVKSFQ